MSDDETLWVKSSTSWHIVSTVKDDVGTTLCGRTFAGIKPQDHWNGNEKTCESCLRIDAATED